MKYLKVNDADGSPRYIGVEGDGTTSNPYVTVTDMSEKRFPLYQYADTVGDKTGAVNMNVNGSVTPVSFYVKPPIGYTYGLARIIAGVKDGGVWATENWGGLGSPLTNGIKMYIKLNGLGEVDMTQVPIRSNFDLANISYDADYQTIGSGESYMAFRFTFTRAGQFVILNGDLGDYIRFEINDNLTGLTTQRVSVQGYQIANP